MFKSLSSRSTRPTSNTSYTHTNAPSQTYVPLPPLPPVPPTPQREIPAIRLVAPTPGSVHEGSPLLEKRRTRTLVPRRSVLGKENRPPPSSSSLRAPAPPLDPSVRVTNAVAREFAAHHQRQFHSVGPSTSLSSASTSAKPSDPLPSTTRGSLRDRLGKKHKRVLVETRAYPDGGQVEVVKDTIGRSTKPLASFGEGSVRGGTITRGSILASKTGTGRAFDTMTEQNAGTELVVKRKKSRGTLDSIRWALGDRTNGARKAEKEKEKEEKEREKMEKEKAQALQKEKEQAREGPIPPDTVVGRRRAKLTIDTRMAPVPVSQTPLDTTSASSVLSPTAETPWTTTTANTTDNEGASAVSGGEKPKWRWTIGRKRTKSSGSSLSSAFDRPTHSRATSLDLHTLMAATHAEEPEVADSSAPLPPRPISLDLPTLMQIAEVEAEGRLPSPTTTPTQFETAPVDFGFEPKTLRKTSVGSIESHAGSGTSRKSSIGSSLVRSVGENASNTGSFAVRAMRSVRSMARLGAWVKTEEDEQVKEKDEKWGKRGTLRIKRKKGKKKETVEDDNTTSGESWEAGALGRDPTITTTTTVPTSQPVTHQKLYNKDERAALGVRRTGEDNEEGEHSEDWSARDRSSSGGSSCVAPSTISFGSYVKSRGSRASSGNSDYAYATRSRQDSGSIAPSLRRFLTTTNDDGEDLEDGDRTEVVSWAAASSDTVKGQTYDIGHNQELPRRTRKPIMGLFDLPSEESLKHIEVRGVKVDKGRVRERVREFEARTEEPIGPAVYSTYSRASAVLAKLVEAPVSQPVAPVTDSQHLSFIEEREYSLASGRCVSVPLPDRPIERPTHSRPLSEQMLRPRPHGMLGEEVAIDIMNAANSDLSDLINRLDLSATPDSKYQATPTARRIPTWTVDSPDKNGSVGRRSAHPNLTSLMGYNHPSLAKSTLLLAQNNVADECDPEVELDISQELQMLIAGQSEDDDLLPSPGMPPTLPLPTPIENMVQHSVKFKEVADSREANTYSSEFSDEAEAETSEEELERGSRKSFDFTGELGQLKAGTRNSFVEALVTAFTTPAIPEATGAEGRLELNVESLNDLSTIAARSSPVVSDDGTSPGPTVAMCESEARASTLPLQLRPVNQQSSGHLNVDFSFGTSQTAQATKRSNRNLTMNDLSSSNLADATFALALANLSRVRSEAGSSVSHGRNASLGSDASSESYAHEHEDCHARTESNVSQSMSSLGNMLHSAVSDPFGFNRSQINLSHLSESQSANGSRTLPEFHSGSMGTSQSNSSFGQVILSGQEDPFDYEMLMRELDEASSMIEQSTQALERSASRRRKRRSIDSDRSSVYFRNGRRRPDSMMSHVSVAPPVSFYNRYSRQLGHSQNTSIENTGSVAHAYATLNGTAGRASGSRSRPDSIYSMASDRSDDFEHMRSGLGDKMFQTGAEHGIPLTSIMASPTNSEMSGAQRFSYLQPSNNRQSYISDRRRDSYFSEYRNSYAPSMAEQRRMSFVSYDSLVDGAGNDRRASIDMDSLYERRGRPSSISSVSVFGDNYNRRRPNKAAGNFRPVSIISMQSDISTQEDDTMVSMIGGVGNARVRRKSVGSTLMLDASPCFQAEKRARQTAKSQYAETSMFNSIDSASTSFLHASQNESEELTAEFECNSILENSPSKGRGRVPPRPFARPRPPAAAKSSAENSRLEEMDVFCRTPPAATPRTRPLAISAHKASAARNRTSGLICTAEPPDTPPLSVAGSDASSLSGGSQSSIDVSKLMDMLGDTPGSINGSASRHRTRARGHGHRRRTSQPSRSSMAISFTAEDLPCSSVQYSSTDDTQFTDSAIIVDPDAQIAELAEMIGAGFQLSDELMASVTRYLALRNEALETVERSQRIWQDTDFSRFALSTFTPPSHPAEIKAMIDHSQNAYTALPADLQKHHRPRHSRLYPRTSPYPTDVTRSVKYGVSPRVRMSTDSVEHALALLPPTYEPISRSTRTVQESPMVSRAAMGFVNQPSPAPLSSVPTNLRPSVIAAEEKSFKQTVRSRIALGARRSVLGLRKKKAAEDDMPASAKKDGKVLVFQSSSAPTPAKENTGPSNQTLRINRPRPKGRQSSSNLRLPLRI